MNGFLRDEFFDRQKLFKFKIFLIIFKATNEVDALNGKQFLTRSQRRLNEDFRHVPKSYEDMDAYTRKLEMEHEQVILLYLEGGVKFQ